MTEQKRMDLPVNEQAAPVAEPAPAAEQAAPAPVPVPPAPPRRPPVRRVGTVTLGLSLIATGLCITAFFFVPGFDIVFAAKLAPLVLVFLGAEVLWATVRRKGDERLRFDFLAAFVGFVLICASLCAATLPVMWRYYGPDRSITQQRLAGELEEQLYAAFQGQEVRSCSTWVNLGGYEFDRQMTLADLSAEDRVGVSLTLGGTVESRQDFAARAAALLADLREAGVDQAYIYWGDEADMWDLDLAGVFDMNADAAQLEQLARHQVYRTDEDGGGWWMEESEAADRQASQSDAAQGEPQQPAVEEAPEGAQLA